MSAPRIISASLSSFYQKLSKLVEIWRSSDKNNFAQFLWDTVYVAVPCHFLLRPVRVRRIAINPSVCLCVCLSMCVCLSSSISLEPLVWSSQFLCKSPVAVARSSSGGVAIPGRSLMSVNALFCTVTDFSAGALPIGMTFCTAVRPHFRQVFFPLWCDSPTHGRPLGANMREGVDVWALKQPINRE